MSILEKALTFKNRNFLKIKYNVGNKIVPGLVATGLAPPSPSTPRTRRSPSVGPDQRAPPARDFAPPPVNKTV